MNPSSVPIDWQKQLNWQFHYWETEKPDFMDRYYPSPGKERTRVNELLSSYSSTLGAILASETDERIHQSVLIGSEVELFYLDDGVSETYTFVFPEQAEPGENKLSFLSPFGLQLLLAGIGHTAAIEIPSGTVQVKIERIAYRDCGRTDENL